MSEFTVGQHLPQLHVPITRSGVVRYSGASTDFNEIHFSDRHARAIGLPSVVAHGMWTMGAGLTQLTQAVGDPARIRSYFVRFTRPVAVPDTDEGTVVIFDATVTEISEGIAKFAITATCGADTVLGAARAEVSLV